MVVQEGLKSEIIFVALEFVSFKFVALKFAIDVATLN